MIILMMFQRGTPDIINLIMLLIGMLLCLLTLNSLFEWLMTKPWKKSGTPGEANMDKSTQTDLNQTSDRESEKQSGQSDLFIQETLNIAKNC
jgi:hypothetical protein